MSLKAFHIVFVSASVLLCIGLSGLCIGNFRAGGGSMQLLWAGCAAGVAIGLMVYGRYFLRKLKNISYL